MPTTSESFMALENVLRRGKEIYGALNQRFSVNPHVILWRMRFRAVNLFGAMGLWQAKNPPNGYGETIKKWRASQKHVGGIVTRSIFVLGTRQKYFTRAELEVVVGNDAGENAIKTLLRTGQELGLLERDGRNYALTEKALDEAFDRVIHKIMDPDIVAFSEFVFMFHQMRRSAEQVGELERSGKLGDDLQRTPLEERLADGYTHGAYRAETVQQGNEIDAVTAGLLAKNGIKIVRVK